MSEVISIDRFGKDHWSTFAYVETRVVDYGGRLSVDHMRCDTDIHPQFANSANRANPNKKYPTRLRDGIAAHHDDWSCVDDLEAAGLLEQKGTGMNPVIVLTDTGRRVVSQLRTHISSEPIATFVPREDEA